jgi:hypothetical protein
MSHFSENLSERDRIDAVLENPEIKSATTIEYRLPEQEGRELKAGHSFVFSIPEEFRGRLVRDVILRHRKAEKYRQGTKEHDPHGAYSRVELHDMEDNQWKQWVDPKGYNPDKYAEWRGASDPENEVLHDWLATVGKVSPDILKVTNVGEHEEYSTSQIHGLEIVFYPELEGVDYEERIYTPGTKFIDIEHDELLPHYGGGSHTEGVYQNAIALNQSGQALYELSKDPGSHARLEGRRLTLDLESGHKLIQAEVAIGDSEHLKEVSPKTHRRMRLGWSKLWVGIEHANGAIDWFIENANIPPQGIIAGGPHNMLIVSGDKLVIEARDDAAYVMGWRLAYEETSESISQAA